MAVWSIIKKSELEGSSYIAPEFYHPDKLKSQKLINKIGITRISNEFDNIKNLYNLSKTTKLSEKRIKIFDLTDAMGNLLKEGIDIKNIEDIGSTKKIVKNNDLIISRLRSYLREIALVHYDDFSQKLVSTEFIVLRQRKETKYTPQFLLIYLLTSEIQSILHWSQTGTQHPRFDEEVLFNLPLPNFSEFINDITEKVNESIILFEDSKLLYSQAEQILLEELGLKDLYLKDDLFYTTTLKEVKDNNRMDTEYYMPKYEKLIKHLRRNDARSLSEVVTFLNHGKQPPYINRGQIPIFTQRHMGNNFLNLDVLDDKNTQTTNEKFYNSQKKYQLREFDILYYSVGAYLGRTNIYLSKRRAMCASFITIIRADSHYCLPLYLMIVLNSCIGKLQSFRYKSASAQQYIYPKDISKFIIPILRKEVQENISNKIYKAHEKLIESKQLLQEAKHEVEEMIEKEVRVK